MTDILVITGLSGAGRSQAADDLEDLGWFVVDNLPTSLIEKVAELGGGRGSTIDHLALVVGSGVHQADITEVVPRLRADGHRVRILFLEASTPEIVKRYGSTRRKHPLSDGSQSVMDLIEYERDLLEPVRGIADIVVDTSDLNVHQLKARLTDTFGEEVPEAGMQVAVVSFGFKHGLPLDVDLVLDCRFLPNPYWVEGLRHHTGLEPEVEQYVLENEVTQDFLARLDDLLDLLLPAYEGEGKSYLTLAFGCTGGRHRSVAITEEVAKRLRKGGREPRVQHRDLPRSG
jgi:RNase adapter protein RapZ